ncbi:HU family DNA-binding protein [Candidatus Pelagibacter sp.]|nr:HU family DNA-binding protein [Candidatus Pelagibacter sp.]
MRINLTKKEIINSIYMQIGLPKKVLENLFDDIFEVIVENLIKYRKIKISNFGTFSIQNKKSRPGFNFKTSEKKIISQRNVVLFKPSKEFKNFINNNNEIK